MKSRTTRLVMALGLLVLPAIGAGCDREPEGSCTVNEVGSGEWGPDVHEVCYPDSTESACAASGGTFREDDNCFWFNVLHPPT